MNSFGQFSNKARRRRKSDQWVHHNGVYQPKISEEDVVNEIIARLTWNKIKVVRIRERIPGMSRHNSTPGIPDLVGVYRDGKAIFLEIKRPGGARRPAQIRFIEEVKQLGAIAGFCESWENVVELFGTYGITFNEKN